MRIVLSESATCSTTGGELAVSAAYVRCMKEVPNIWFRAYLMMRHGDDQIAVENRLN